ncbi:hypothetical protein IPA_08755 [Ignicoccus pacificus DSM 13166]|uniref:Uncharacterized protein n=1 Tax=Ignicoccus pacificus DSM 13166 TaxID=940294 RepID=A0A977KDD5_9CREN|nr:hypothetical protein IPA_08755 [Ignicoccus pacificus DSM 13166]
MPNSLLLPLGMTFPQAFDVSYCCGRYALLLYNRTVVLFWEDGTLIRRRFEVPELGYLLLMRNGFWVCGSSCRFYTCSGEVESMPVKALGRPVAYEGRVLVPTPNGVVSLSSTRVIIPIKAKALASCNKMLSVSSEKSYLLEGNNIVRVKDFSSFDTAFSPYCDKVAFLGKELRVYDSSGKLVLKKSFKCAPNSIGWNYYGLWVALNCGEEARLVEIPIPPPLSTLPQAPFIILGRLPLPGIEAWQGRR